ncbi:hypothetical protein F0160_06105 [Paraburkholderia sp. JPY303]|uniref:Uncharacterized protein n=1 Tax=Paraburkholderia atlantica TaxID=2654982 RepID=A0A7W8V4U2_PARAM|nr:hypothetical protein [Paraburkholderia atlantica]MBB5423087.1 hypothetical protein [Paraburkholderia atlantica]NUY30092.1 hypothetical protein [Paraburkholderia atlantica]
MEKPNQDGTGKKTPDEEVCDLCRITYSIYANFPPVPSAQAMNAETGEFFPFDRLRSLATGYDMIKARGYAWACDCRGRSRKRFDEQFVLKDGTGRPFANAHYRVRVGPNVVASGVTDADGRTQRISSIDARRLSLEISRAT